MPTQKGIGIFITHPLNQRDLMNLNPNGVKETM
jgi:hypothetical protein